MLSPSPSSSMWQQSSWKQERHGLCNQNAFPPLRGGGTGASDGESGVSWMEDVEEKEGVCSSRQLRTVVVLVPADGGVNGMGANRSALGWGRESSRCVLSLSGGSEGIFSCVPSAVMFAS